MGIHIDRDKLLNLIKEVKSTSDERPILIGTDKAISVLKTVAWFWEVEKYADVKIISSSFASASIEDDKVYIVPNTQPNLRSLNKSNI